MINLCSEIGHYSLNKYTEELCGDNVKVIETDDSVILVLADGLGSGVKANILSMLTSTIISTMSANDIELEEIVETIVNTLPVCQTRGVAYSTFTIITIFNNETCEIVQYDNPKVILLRNGHDYDYPVTTVKMQGKTILKSKFDIYEDDLFYLMSDGVIHAGVGKYLNFGWELKDVKKFVEKYYDKNYSSKTFATMLLDECNRLYDHEPGDDTTVACVKIKKRCPVNILMGPAENKTDDFIMMALFFAKQGKKIVCGGTTANIVSKYLGKEIETDLNYIDSKIPPISYIEGVDLVTEGVITINKVVEYANNYLSNNQNYQEWGVLEDGASQIARILFEEATDIYFYVGRAINPAHQNPDLPITFSIKMNLVEQLSVSLKKMGKKINVSYF